MSYRDHDPVELVDYSGYQPTARQPRPTIQHHRPPSQQSTTQSSSMRTQSQQSQASFSRPLSTQAEPATQRVVSRQPETSTSQPSHQPSEDSEPLTQPVSAYTEQDTKLLESETDEVTEQQLLQATGGGGEIRGLKLTRRHSVETGKEATHHQDDDTASARSFSGTQKERVVGQIPSGAYSITHGKELHGKEWEDAMQREMEEEMARERVRMRERRREIEQRERRRERDQKNRDYRARERQEREREREAAKERRLAQDQDSRYPPPTGTTDDTHIHESPESFL